MKITSEQFKKNLEQETKEKKEREAIKVRKIRVNDDKHYVKIRRFKNRTITRQRVLKDGGQ